MKSITNNRKNVSREEGDFLMRDAVEPENDSEVRRTDGKIEV